MALSTRRKLFVEAYLRTYNATLAARQAGYKGDDNTLSTTGYRLLRIDEIKEAIATHLQASAMSADEVLMRLADMARADLGDFTDVKSLDDLKGHPKSHLVKKIKQKTYTLGEQTVNEIEIELHNSQTSLQDLAKRWALFTDNLNLSGSIEHSLIILPAKDE